MGHVLGEKAGCGRATGFARFARSVGLPWRFFPVLPRPLLASRIRDRRADDGFRAWARHWSAALKHFRGPVNQIPGLQPLVLPPHLRIFRKPNSFWRGQPSGSVEPSAFRPLQSSTLPWQSPCVVLQGSSSCADARHNSRHSLPGLLRRRRPSSSFPDTILSK